MQQENKKTGAAILAIALSVFGLGWIGGHKFYLGYTNAGIIYLAVSILTCGAGAVIFNIIALVEGILYLTKSDEEFYQTYQIETKEWF
jgi:TM2 domain-containing membrane protein YozV